MRHITKDVLERIKQWEGFVGYAYDDADPSIPKKKIMPGDEVKGTLTIGYGHTGSDVKPGMLIDEAHGELLLLNDLARYEQAVAENITVPITDNQFGALVSFAFNIGLGGAKQGDGFLTSTLVKRLNDGDYDCVPGELAKWSKTRINGKLVLSKGLVNRRAVEAGLWAEGEHVATNTVPVEPTRKPMITVQSATLALPVVAGVGSALGDAGPFFSGNGPVQWALAAIVVMGAAIGGFLFIQKHMKKG